VADLRHEVADLRHQKAELERRLARTNGSRPRQATQLPLPDDAGPAYAHGEPMYPAAGGRGGDTTVMPGHYGRVEAADDEGLFTYDATADGDTGYADSDGAYSDGAYSDSAYSDSAYSDRACSDRASDSAYSDYGDEPFDEQPFEEDAFEDDSFTDQAFGGQSFRDQASDDEAFDEVAHGDEALQAEGPAAAYGNDHFEDPAPDEAGSGDAGQAPGGRTETLVNRGRRNASSPWRSRKRLTAAGSAAGVLLILILVLILSGNGASWPTSVTTVQNEITKACQNGDVASEPGQVNFACGKSTRQVLWVFSLLTSYNNPHFNDLKTGRVGLEPITPSEGGEVAWSLNMHHPYYPDNPIDSLEVAARAINNIIGGATLTATGGSSVVQPGLESSPANCLRYTGSSKLRVRKGFPSVCTRPITSAAGQADLVGDVYQKWIVGAGPRAAQNAALLFENYNNPGDPQVQLVLKQLAHSAT
jgi:hypothetical protein